MKNLNKNFIAFTLSEMMIVLLILSVISAATLPAITQRNEVKPRYVESSWKYDYQYNKGFFYKNDNPADTEIVIGYSINSANGEAQKNAANNIGGHTALRLMRPNIIQHYVTQNRSDIAFFGMNGNYLGKIATDDKGNIAIGKDVAYPHASPNRSQNNVFIGHSAGHDMNQVVGQSRNVIIGNDAASRHSYVKHKNTIIGYDISYASLDCDNVVIGAYAAKDTYAANYIKESVSLGAFSSYKAPYSVRSVNVGYYSGANSSLPESDGTGYNNFINIGAYAGYDSGNNNSESSCINIGYQAGQNASSGMRSINIGYKAGEDLVDDDYAPGISIGAFSNGGRGSLAIGEFANASNANNHRTISIGYNAGGHGGQNFGVNIGANAGNNFDGERNVNIGDGAGYCENTKTRKFSVSIGKNAGKDKTGDNTVFIGSDTNLNTNNSIDNSVIIGCRGISVTQAKVCIGGRDIGNWGIPGYAYATVIGTPNYWDWNYTAIYLLSKYVASFGGTLTAFSDKTLKENIRKTNYGINKLKNINIYQYNFKNDKSREPRIGVIAQELMKYYPNAVSNLKEKINDKEYLSVSTDWIVFSLAQSIKDVDNALTVFQSDLVKNLSLIKKLTEKVCIIESRLNKIAISNKKLKIQLDEIDSIIARMERK